jgi:hypothetical protein
VDVTESGGPQDFGTHAYNLLKADADAHNVRLWMGDDVYSGRVPSARPEIICLVDFERLGQRERWEDVDRWKDRTPTQVLPRGFNRYLRIMFPVFLLPTGADATTFGAHPELRDPPLTWKQLAAKAGKDYSPLMSPSAFYEWFGDDYDIAYQDFLQPEPITRQRLIDHLDVPGQNAIALARTHHLGLYCLEGSLADVFVVADYPEWFSVWSSRESWYANFEDLSIEAWLACTDEIAERLLADPLLECHDIPSNQHVFPERRLSPWEYKKVRNGGNAGHAGTVS